jgi:hypothetical protein
MKIHIEVSYSLESIFKGINEINLDDTKEYKISDILMLYEVPIDEVGIVIINGVKSSHDDIVFNGDKIKLYPPIIAG